MSQTERMGEAAADVAQAWEAEITERLDQLESGDAHTLEAHKVLRRIDARLRTGRPQEPSCP